jgi:hypothetical protein
MAVVGERLVLINGNNFPLLARIGQRAATRASTSRTRRRRSRLRPQRRRSC